MDKTDLYITRWAKFHNSVSLNKVVNDLKQYTTLFVSSTTNDQYIR